ncbi:glycosyl hydrolase [Paraflavitalea speifideaquila]|uniref:glycosyl hydrolase n=1 Tax=Paraflavitalea speifideaquila TaxID=3076558 RepID=UPI0028F08D79|nr:glycosyl hydrolase [Paraflavitalea speifideiaquila]
MLHIKPYALSSLLLLFCPAMLQAQKAAPVTGVLEKGFLTPPDSVKPSVYWYWMSDNVSAEGVVKDLEAMQKVGIGRAFIGNIGYPATEVPYGQAPLFSEPWWQATEAAIRTASEKGIEIGLFNSPGWSQSGGPWIKPAQSMRYLTSVEWRVKAPGNCLCPYL